ncbi:hypothetical protein B0T09DRAFT_142929 [Sordaria sp. MPI-SDFR-AT-0083]|nr:hypothetical protein B0T09DRAFT_142929 [Sordaria sp. MPI-SDFR-AT-0083]
MSSSPLPHLRITLTILITSTPTTIGTAPTPLNSAHLALTRQSLGFAQRVEDDDADEEDGVHQLVQRLQAERDAWRG